MVQGVAYITTHCIRGNSRGFLPLSKKCWYCSFNSSPSDMSTTQGGSAGHSAAEKHVPFIQGEVTDRKSMVQGHLCSRASRLQTAMCSSLGLNVLLSGVGVGDFP